MTTLAEAQVEIIEAQTKLIKQQSIEIMELEQKLEQREYNRRFTNSKFKKQVPISPPFRDISVIHAEKRTSKK
jgi:very-short-patch-repair endonuclease